MIGVYDYTVILTYLSLISGSLGILVSLHGYGHPYVGIFFLLICGLCDAFDGKVARTKKNRTALEKSFGVQVDSLADLVCFGVLPASIGMAMLRTSEKFSDAPIINEVTNKRDWYVVLLFIIAVLYVLAALIRLAYFNATEEERNKEMSETGKMSYTGLPVTSAALIFPFVVLLHFVTRFDFSIIYFVTMFFVAILFLGKFKIKKISGAALYFLVFIGLIEFVLLLLFIIRNFR
ncbi:MAG: CDP-alcohol phosphatidyltransferase family protein [Eubacterium sp.]|nr:CDP-alcohol phosphatidyltransferase family protein [Eubacterium sp.]